MPDKLTDKEIVKALECCSINKKCTGCYFNTQTTDDMCPRVLMRNTLDLINRLQAENERLKKEVKNCKEHYKMACSERNEFLESLKTAKAEAYKECLEKVEQRDVSESDFYIMVKKTEFDNLLKDLVDNNEE